MVTLRTAPGMRERAPGKWELIVESGRDPVTGKRRQISRTFHGTLSEARKARAVLLAEVTKGRHTGTRATVDELFEEWVIELRRKGRSPNTIYGYEKCYSHNIAATLGKLPVTAVTTKTLTDLYRAHQDRGLAPRTVYQIHACLSSMLTQACRWGWRDSNPAKWAEPPQRPNTMPVVASPDDVRALIAAAESSRRPEYARALLVAATTGLRRAELCALRRDRDLDLDGGVLRISSSVVELPGEPLGEIPTKNRRVRTIALDRLTVSILRAQIELLEQRAEVLDTKLSPDHFVFSDVVDAAVPWRPSSVSQYFSRLRDRAGLPHLTLHSLRKFMETYGQEMGYSMSQVAHRAGHNPSVAARYYTGKVPEADRALAEAIGSLLESRPGG